jgi:hypothetical protein
MYRDCHLLFHGRKPLLLFVSIFIDGGLMNSTHSRSAIPIVLTILNDSAKNSTLVGFGSKSPRLGYAIASGRRSPLCGVASVWRLPI